MVVYAGLLFSIAYQSRNSASIKPQSLNVQLIHVGIHVGSMVHDELER
jgi:hypothetical protein